MPTKRINFYLEEDQLLRLKRHSEATRVAMVDIVRLAIDAYLEAQNRPEPVFTYPDIDQAMFPDAFKRGPLHNLPGPDAQLKPDGLVQWLGEARAVLRQPIEPSKPMPAEGPQLLSDEDLAILRQRDATPPAHVEVIKDRPETPTKRERPTGIRHGGMTDEERRETIRRLAAAGKLPDV